MNKPMKRAWIREFDKVISFHEITDSCIYEAPTDDFWPRIMHLISLGYRVM